MKFKIYSSLFLPSFFVLNQLNAQSKLENTASFENSKKTKYKSFFKLFVLSIFVGCASGTFAQGECLSGGCPISTDQWPPGTTLSTTSTSFTTATSTMNGGQFAVCSVVNGTIYEWSLCPSDGALNSLGYDAEMSLFNNFTDQFICFSNDYCGNYPKIHWQATFDGAVNVQIDEVPCTANSVSTKLRWRVYDPNTSINNIEKQLIDIELYPNPTSDILKIKCDKLTLFNKVYVYNVLGKIVLEDNFFSNKKNSELNVSTLVSGVYTIVFKGINEIKTLKFIKVN